MKGKCFIKAVRISVWFTVLAIMGVLAGCAGTGSSVQESSSLQEGTPSVGQGSIQRDAQPTQLTTAAVRYQDTLYYLGDSVTGEAGDRGCYLHTQQETETKWLSYDSYGRGLYVDGEEFYLLTHDENSWYLSAKEGEERSAALLPYDASSPENGVLEAQCIRVYDGYVYVLSESYQEGALVCKTLSRYSLRNGTKEEIYRAEDEYYI